MALRLRRTRPAAVVRLPSRTRTLSGTARVVLEVSAPVTKGQVSSTDLAKWVQDAIDRYHTWRHGWVGIDCRGAISVPEVTEWQDE